MPNPAWLPALGIALVAVGATLNFLAAHRWDDHHITGIAAAWMTCGGIVIGLFLE